MGNPCCKFSHASGHRLGLWLITYMFQNYGPEGCSWLSFWTKITQDDLKLRQPRQVPLKLQSSFIWVLSTKERLYLLEQWEAFCFKTGSLRALNKIRRLLLSTLEVILKFGKCPDTFKNKQTNKQTKPALARLEQSKGWGWGVDRKRSF